uniref:Ephrin RBD domain-containing protein n=1 Tax=Rhabditophanes sp. KR3021 TaxID=114890 RepID=A0AC35TZ19_9BILA
MGWNIILTKCFLLFLATSILARRLPDITWDSSNSIFNENNSDHIIQAHLMDKIKINCPASTEHHRHYIYSKLYVVSKFGYDHCSLYDSKLIGTCQNPSTESSVNIVFRDVSPLPGALLFKPGEIYYLISTSNGTLNGIDNSEDGICKTNNMRLKFEIIIPATIVPNTIKSKTKLKSTNDNKQSEYDSLDQPLSDDSSFTKNEDELQLLNDNTPLVYTIHNTGAEFENDEEDLINGQFNFHYNSYLFVIIFILHFFY